MIGKQQFDTFVEKRFDIKDTLFYEPIKKLKIKTFASLQVPYSKTSSANKVQQNTMQKNIFGQLLVLQEKQPLDLKKVFCFQLTPVPYSLATTDGWPIKTAKSKLLTCIEV